jgi:hypothetical protein
MAIRGDRRRPPGGTGCQSSDRACGPGGAALWALAVSGWPIFAGTRARCAQQHACSIRVGVYVSRSWPLPAGRAVRSWLRCRLPCGRSGGLPSRGAHVCVDLLL